MTATPERSHFKHSFGQANHFLVTIIVGLHTVRGANANPPSHFPMAWNPRDAARSADRSEAFAIQGAVVFLMTALDQYLADVARLTKPAATSLESSLQAVAENDQGLRGEVRAFAEFSGSLRTAELALVEAAIQWRNRLVHPGSNARFNSDLRKELVRHALEFQDDYRHLDPDRMIRAFATAEPAPSVKEVTGMIAATHRFIAKVDSAVLETIDLEHYLMETLRRHLGEGSLAQAQGRASRLWGRTESRAHQAILTLAKQHGFSDATEDSAHGLASAAIDRVAALSARDAMEVFRPSSSKE